jgi:UDP-N-acetylglucosamine--dolichyl-phosphate N-acetylglucosaminephosphotransferase
MLLEIAIAAAISFIVTLLFGNYLKSILRRALILATDINKPHKPIIETSGGIVLLLGLIAGSIAFLVENEVVKSGINLVYLLLAVLSAFIATFIGFLDDIVQNKIRLARFFKGTIKKYIEGGIPQREKVIWSILAIIPFMLIPINPVINLLGITLNFTDFIWLLLFLEALVLIFYTNVVNMLEGLNGLSITLVSIATIFLDVFAYTHKNWNAFAIETISLGGMLGYFYYGSYPAKLLPGDSLTYLLGMLLGEAVFLSQAYTLALFLTIPWLAEFILKARARFHAHSWGIVQKDGTLKSPHGNKIFSLTHIFYTKGKFREYEIVIMLALLEITLGLIGIFITTYLL